MESEFLTKTIIKDDPMAKMIHAMIRVIDLDASLTFL